MDISEKNIKNLLPKRPEESNKGTFGHVLNIAGSEFYSGAAYFSSLAPLRVGCGRSTLASGDGVLKSVSSLSPDIILFPLEIKALMARLSDFSAISIGCGLSTGDNAVKLFKEVLKKLGQTDIPLVIDADGLNILAASPELKKLPSKTILTPHPLEMSRLMGVGVENILQQPVFWAKKCCDEYNCTTVLKLHKTVVADSRGHIYINNTGNTALSHGGSGDVLTGMITGFLAQGMNVFDASVLAVYLHGLTAEIASKELSEYSTLASDLLKYIPMAIKTLI